MLSCTNRRAALTMAALLLSVGCHRAPATANVPAPTSEAYCWNTVFSSYLAPDTVATHFQRAFEQLGLTRTSWSARGDTAWAHGGPTRVERETGPAIYEARVVAYRVRDSTHFRHFVSVTPPPGGWAVGSDSGTVNGRRYEFGPSARHIAFCGDLGRAAQVHGIAARDPGPEESLEVWKRVP